MENGHRVTAMNTGVKYGLYLGVLSCLLTLISYYGGLQEIDMKNPFSTSNVAMMFVQWALVFGVLYLGIRYYKSNNEGLLTFGEGLSTAMFIGLFSGIILALFTYIFVAYIAPDFLGDMSEVLDTDEMSEEEAEVAEGFLDMMVSPTVMAFSSFINRIFGALIFGIFASLFLKNN